MSSKRIDGPFIAIPRWASELLRKDPVGTRVLVEILMYVNHEDQTVTASYQYIANSLGIHRSTVIRAVNRLVELNVLMKNPRHIKGAQLTNEFVVNYNNPSVFDVHGGSADATGVVAPVLLGGGAGATPRGSAGATQIRRKNKKILIKKETDRDFSSEKIDMRLK